MTDRQIRISALPKSNPTNMEVETLVRGARHGNQGSAQSGVALYVAEVQCEMREDSNTLGAAMHNSLGSSCLMQWTERKRLLARRHG